MSILTETFTLNNGVKIPKVGFGTWQIPDGDTAYNAVANALKAGYRHIDTAYVYGNEKSVGKAINDSGIAREDIFLTSKLPGEVKDASQVADYFNTTLSNLDTDYLDLYLIHAPWPWSQIGTRFDKENVAVWKELEKLYQTGKIKSIGISNFDAHDVKNLLDNTEIVPAVDQIQYYAGFTQPENTKFAQDNGILVEAYSPLATGDLLTNPTMTSLADQYSVSVPQLALRFVIQNGLLPLPKSTSEAHIEANAELDFTISDDDMAKLNAIQDAAPTHFHNPTQK
ncbi:2,5-diketo-D-gluconic acid reductase [Secundilactobacillus paracollinoides]|uniref:2,5-diketo-D-gluconic acid reductase n=1 Tax=Secundilactobacillus paracollinoides TaxID=240427 RepID=A0A1B2J0Z9_9LACO|nr:aldo/keto reductase [Secundilactobacillus paracollinoides]ANZ62050.1 2,5-diketo-D-gluconic acid reductase [Secundilactobacillus paracollinoides]ANZ63734.1 2,5-diketo-D-gluconic acid reductase [Secundilactobacillus paracollinoides]ANZ67995.1 2,5-diketo-D-gluconic acid reductase [Secundilactobacillus paracollinoides]